MFLKLNLRLKIQSILIILFVFVFCGCSQQKPAPAPAPEVKQPTPKIESNGSAKHSGEASVYADKLQGKKTASGEPFDQNKSTAASKTLPLGTKAKVTNKKTGKSTTVTITDRGPYVKGRQIDLSKTAAKEIEMDSKGVANVDIEPINPNAGK